VAQLDYSVYGLFLLLCPGYGSRLHGLQQGEISCLALGSEKCSEPKPTKALNLIAFGFGLGICRICRGPLVLVEAVTRGQQGYSLDDRVSFCPPISHGEILPDRTIDVRDIAVRQAMIVTTNTPHANLRFPSVAPEGTDQGASPCLSTQSLLVAHGSRVLGRPQGTGTARTPKKALLAGLAGRTHHWFRSDSP
jgi:hypothetical protein